MVMVVVVSSSRGCGAVKAEEFVVRALNVHVAVVAVIITRSTDDAGA